MKKNYFKFKGICFRYLALFSVFCLLVAFSPKKGKNILKNKPITATTIFDPASYIPLTVTGFSDDVIANGIGDLNTTTTNDVDGANFCYLSQGTQITASSTPTAYGLPTNGVLTIANSDLFFKLASYDDNNALRIEQNGVAGVASVSFAEADSFETLHLAVTSGSGASNLTITVNFSDATSQVFSSVNTPDWFGSTTLPTVISGIGRGSRLDNGLENPFNNPRIYRLDLAIDAANQSKVVTGLKIQKNSGGVFNLFAVSAKLVPDCPGPTNITATTVNAFDADITWDSAGGTDTFEVGIVDAGDQIPASGDASATNSFSFSNLVPETTYDVYVRTVCTAGGFSFWTGPFSFTTPVACVAPTGIVVSSISTTAATVTWSAGSSTNWEFAYVPSGSPAPLSGTALTSPTTDLSTLTENTSYDVYVRADCGGNGYSAWSMVTFRTTCSPVISINEDFESVTIGAIPNCWSLINGGDANTWGVQSGFPAYPHSGTKFARISYSSTAHNDFLITPAFTVTEHVSDIISFWSRNYSATYIERFNVLVSTTGNQESDFTDVLASDVGPSTTYTEYTYDLSAYIGQTIYFAIQATSTDEYYLFVDDLMTTGIPICEPPTSLAASTITQTTATLSWDGGSTATEWEIIVQNSGGGEPTIAGDAVVATTYDATYTAGTVAEFYVRTVCPNNAGYSPWAGPFTFGGYTALQITSGLSDDVIANGVGASAGSTTNDIDNGDYVYLAKNYKLTATDADLTYGLPINGVIGSPNVPGLLFKMGSYSANNSLRIETAGVANAGTFTFGTVYAAEKLYFLVTSGGGSSSMSGTIHFTDGSTQSIATTAVPDWFNQTSLPVAISGIGRVKTTTNVLENPSGNPRIYELTVPIDVANQTKGISSVDFQKETGTGIVNIFAASLKYSSATLASDDFVNDTSLKAYPNPIDNILNLEYSSEISTVKVINLLGQTVITKAIHATSTQIDMSSLNAGAYMLNVTLGDKVKLLKVIKK